MPSILALHTRERRHLLVYLLLATLLLTALASKVIYVMYKVSRGNAAAISQKIRRQQRMFNVQNEHLAELDTLHEQLAEYNPKVMASFINTDIRNQLLTIRRVYVDNDTLSFYRSFDQAANFYQMMYQDKQLLAKQQDNRQLFAKELLGCTNSVNSQQAAAPSTISPILPPAPASPLLPK